MTVVVTKYIFICGKTCCTTNCVRRQHIQFRNEKKKKTFRKIKIELHIPYKFKEVVQAYSVGYFVCWAIMCAVSL